MEEMRRDYRDEQHQSRNEGRSRDEQRNDEDYRYQSGSMRGQESFRGRNSPGWEPDEYAGRYDMSGRGEERYEDYGRYPREFRGMRGQRDESRPGEWYEGGRVQGYGPQYGRNYESQYGNQYGQYGYGGERGGRGSYLSGGGSFPEGGRYGMGRYQGYGQEAYGQGRYGQMGRASSEREHENRPGGWAEDVEQFGGAMAGRVRRMFRSPKGYKRSDERIREDVCDQLGQQGQLDPSDIEVTVANGEVTLSGAVPERYMKWQAEQVVDNVPGVNEIHNQLRVRRPESASESSTQQTTSSTSLTGSGSRSHGRS